MTLLFFIIIWIIAMIYRGYNHDVYNKESKNKAIKEKDDYYLDSNFKTRKVTNDHPVIRIVKNGNLIERDMITNVETNLTEQSKKEYRQKEYEKAIKEGRDIYYYDTQFNNDILGRRYKSIKDNNIYVLRWMCGDDFSDSGEHLKKILSINHLPWSVALFMNIDNGKFIKVAFRSNDEINHKEYDKNVLNMFIMELNKEQENYYNEMKKINYRNINCNDYKERKFENEILFSVNSFE